MKNCFPFGIKALTLLLKQWMLLIYFGKWPFEFNLLDTGRVFPPFSTSKLLYTDVSGIFMNYMIIHELHSLVHLAS